EALVARLAPIFGSVLLSTTTRSGMTIAANVTAAHPEVVGCVFLPWDRRAIQAWLESTGMAVCVVMETEIWPKLFTWCQALGSRLCIANGRIGAAEVRRYALARPFFRRVLDAAAWIGVQDARARDAFVAIGADPSRIEVTGNVKLDASPLVRPLPRMFA